MLEHTLTAPFNDLAAVKDLASRYPGQIAAVIVEPIVGNMGVGLPEKGFLEGLRRICDEEEMILIFDEVITGFRAAFGGAQALYGIQADLTCLGKIIGGGLPVGAYGGKRAIMEKVAPLGGVYQAGTLSGNPLAMTAGIETLKILKSPGTYADLEKRTLFLTDGILQSAQKRGVPISINRATGLFTVFFTDGPVRDYPSAKLSDTRRFAEFFIAMMERGVYLPPSPSLKRGLSRPPIPERTWRKTVAACRWAFRKI